MKIGQKPWATGPERRPGRKMKLVPPIPGSAVLAFDAAFLLEVLVTHSPATYAQLRKLAEDRLADPRAHLNELIRLGLAQQSQTSSRVYEPTIEGTTRAHTQPPPPATNPLEWIAETDLCLSLRSFAQPRGVQLLWHRQGEPLYDLGVSPHGNPHPPLRWAVPQPPADHAILPMAIKYVRSVRLDSELFDWARDTCEKLYVKEEWKSSGFFQPPALVLMLRGRAAKDRTPVEYAHAWRDVISAVIPGTTNNYWDLFNGAPEVLICDEPSVRKLGPSARVVSLNRWRIGALWYNNHETSKENAA